jgi:hypothetical protein
MNYADARAQIVTGDLISVRTAHGFLGWLTQVVTRSPYTHSGIARWMGDELYMAELNGGRNHLIPMSQLTGFDVSAAPEGLADIDGAIAEWLRVAIPYGSLAFAAIGVLDWLRLTSFVHWRRILVCSGYCVAIYETAGWPEHTRILSPRALAALLTFKFNVTQPASAGFSL